MHSRPMEVVITDNYVPPEDELCVSQEFAHNSANIPIISYVI